MSRFTITPSSPHWATMPTAILNRVKDMIHQACERKGCTPDDLDIAATFENRQLMYVSTKLKAAAIKASLLKRIWNRTKGKR